LQRIIGDVKAINPYPGGGHWEPTLRELARRLNDATEHPNGFRWFERDLDGLARADRGTLTTRLTDLQRRLALLEESLAPDGLGKSKDEIKALLPSDAGGPKPVTRDSTERENNRPERHDPLEPDRGRRAAGPGAVEPDRGLGGFGPVGWLLILGLFIAALVVAALRARRRLAARPTNANRTTVPTELTLATLLQHGDGATGEQLWRQADDLARAGRNLDALRTLYLAVLALLHRADLIRFAPTRTNGEYLAQVRSRTELYFFLESLTELFEQKFYGAKSCQPDEYDMGRRLAEQVRGGISP
jgi:hypothetical protein